MRTRGANTDFKYVEYTDTFHRRALYGNIFWPRARISLLRQKYGHFPSAKAVSCTLAMRFRQKKIANLRLPGIS
jgi:hypothetical protein